MLRISRWGALVCGFVAAGCGDTAHNAPPQASSVSPSASGSAASAPDAPALVKRRAPERSGGSLARSVDGKRLYVADEDNKVLRVVQAPLDAAAAAVPAKPPTPRKDVGPFTAPPSVELPPPPGKANQVEVALPGAPANVLALDGRVLVTVRDPGLLLVMSEVDGSLREEARVPVAADAWGLAIDPKENLVLVSSAWTHTVSAVDLASAKVLWSQWVAREPRGIAIHPDGKRAYVSHLTSADLTRLDEVGTTSPRMTVVPFPASPNRAPSGFTLTASLGYALVIDDDGNRLLAARHAMGGLAHKGWAGLPTVDVLQTANDTPLVTPREPKQPIKATGVFTTVRKSIDDNKENYRRHTVEGAIKAKSGLVQPRAMIVRHKTKTVWVASEGRDSVFELSLYAGAPAERPIREIGVGSFYEDPKFLHGIPHACGAPTGLALSEDEDTLYVHCRSTFDVVSIPIGQEPEPSKDESPANPEDLPPAKKRHIVRLAEDPLGEAGSRGRRLYYSAIDHYSSEGAGCASCHPDGRDDGHVWHEVLHREEGVPSFLAHQNLAHKTKEGRLGFPRQTPMLAGRVNASGPYGWTGSDKNLTERLAHGFTLHQWEPWSRVDASHWMTGERANALTVFLRKGLVSPPALGRALTEVEQRGKKVFESEGTQCTQCHVATSEFTNRTPYRVDLGAPTTGFEDEGEVHFKTPSLLFVSGTPPYYHDGRVGTLAALVNNNRDRMGKTSQLSEADRAALIAYLETL